MNIIAAIATLTIPQVVKKFSAVYEGQTSMLTGAFAQVLRLMQINLVHILASYSFQCHSNILSFISRSPVRSDLFIQISSNMSILLAIKVMSFSDKFFAVHFRLTTFLQLHYGPWGDSASNRDEYQESSWG
jgi:hypothetical protein